MRKFLLFLVSGLLILALAIMARKIINSPTGLSLRQVYSDEAAAVAKANAIKIQQQRDRAMWMQWKSLEIKQRLSVEKSLLKIKELPAASLRWASFWWGAVVSAIITMVGTALVIAVAIYQMARSNSETIALAFFSLRGRSRDELLAAREETKLEIARLKYFNQHPEVVIDAHEPIAIDAAVPVPAASECLDNGLIAREGNRFLWGFDKQGEPYFMTLKKDGFKAAIIGMTEQGKTYKMVTLASQCFFKGYQGIVIDLHYNAERSLYQYLKPFTAQDSVYWCVEREEVNNTFCLIEETLDLRLSAKSNTTPLLLVIDDALAIGNSLDYAEGFASSVIRCVTEGPKAKISVLVAAHNWQADSMPKQFRSNFNYRCAFRCDASEAHLLFQDKQNKYSKLTPDLKSGECILLDAAGDVQTLQGPVWDAATLQRMAAQATHAPSIVEREPFKMPEIEEVETFGRLHVFEGGKRA